VVPEAGGVRVPLLGFSPAAAAALPGCRAYVLIHSVVGVYSSKSVIIESPGVAIHSLSFHVWGQQTLAHTWNSGIIIVIAACGMPISGAIA
jgi:hypothetical protein